MNREFSRLGDGRFDLLVVGGGIYGAWSAYDAALRGLRVALVERDDWGAGTSSASSKLVHGGLRYLEHFWVLLVRKTLRERRRLAMLGPHRVRPLRFVLPIRRGDRYGALRLSAGLTLYDALAPDAQTAGRHGRLSRDEVLARCPFLASDDLASGFEFGDCTTDDARLTLEVVAGALAAGAIAVNHAQAVRWLGSGRRVEGAAVVDRASGSTAEVRASLVLDATGPWIDRPSERAASLPLARLSKGVHLVLPGLPGERAVFLWSRSDGRPIFLIPWYGRTLLGTTDTEHHGDPGDARVEEEDVRYLLSEANRALATRFADSDILGAFAGLRALRNLPARSPSAISREWSLEAPFEGLLVSVGGKLTSARADAARAIDRVLLLLGRKPLRSPTEERAFPWRPEMALAPWLEEQGARGTRLGLDAGSALAAAYRYGTTLPALHELLRARPALAARIDPELPFAWVEIVHAARNEMALGLEDILRRRVPLLPLARWNEARLAAAADLAAETLGWDGGRRETELHALRATADRRWSGS